MVISAEELNLAFIAACEECPQFEAFDDDQEELVRGEFINVARLHERGISELLRYWKNPNTIGGSILLNSGYKDALSPEYAIFLE